MFVIPVRAALSSDTEQNNLKINQCPSFKMQVTQDTKLFLKTARKLAKANPDSRFAEKLLELQEVLKDATKKIRRGDALRLHIEPLGWDGIEAFSVASVKLEAVGKKIGGKSLSIIKSIVNNDADLECRTIIDEALELLAAKNLKAKPVIRLHEAIMNAQKGLNSRLESVRETVSLAIEKIVPDTLPPKHPQVSVS